ncbi:MAG: ABC transporter permease [Acidobacteriota bacterium]
MNSFSQDLNYGLRMLIKRPGFTIVAVLTLTLGIGASTAIFSIVNGVLLRPLSYPDAERIITLWQNNLKEGVPRDEVSPANFIDWQEQNQICSEMASAEHYTHSLTGEGEPESFRSWLVTKGFFRILAVNALYGRTFLDEDYQPGNEYVVVISYGLWQRRFGSDPNLVGKKLLLNSQPHTVVGIMPAEFQFPPGKQLWAPRIIDEDDRRARGSGYLQVIGRLNPEVTVAQAQENMNAIAARLAQQYPKTNQDIGITVLPLPERLVGQVRRSLLVLLGAVGFVLLIACANVANLLLARAAERQKELAIRVALGAGRYRLIRQLLTESLSLALIGGIGGVLLASWSVSGIKALNPANLPKLEQINVDGQVLGFALAVSVLTALIFGLAPAIQFSNLDVQKSLKDSGQRATGSVMRRRLRHVLVISEIALALVLLIGAGLLVRSLSQLLQVDPGFAVNKGLTLEVHAWWGQNRVPEQRAAFFAQTLDQIAALPGIKAAGAVSALPFHDDQIEIKSSFTIAGRPTPMPGEEPGTYVTIATPDYFTAMGIPLQQGRFFTKFDNADATPVVLISQTMARRFWPDEDPVGKKITIRSKMREIIGVVGDVRHNGFDSELRCELFLPHLQAPTGSMTYIVQTTVDPLTVLPAVKNAIWAVNKEQPFSSIATIDQLVTQSLAERRFNLLLLGCFATIALLLAMVGIYGVMAYSVTQRTHEIGIRLALGAQTSNVLKLVLGEGMLLTLIGVGIGLTAALALTRLMASLLYGVSATDPITFILLSLLLASVALLASYVPARRAMKVDPMVALRYE